VRSTFKIGKSPLCLTDSDANNAYDTRDVVGMPCDIAAAIADGREMWAMFAEPGIVKWNNGGFRIHFNEEGNVSLSPEGFNNSNVLMFRDGKHIEAYHHQKCIDIGQLEPMDFFKHTSSVHASSKKKLKDNDLHNILFDNNKDYHFGPNDPKPFVQINFNSLATYISAVEITWTKAPKV